MSESKRRGARDISDLKARLGLKKGGKAKKGGGAVIPPPGAGGGNLPPPPGAEPPKPKVSDDPFGAMNAAAAHGAAVSAARGPEIVIVNDGSAVEKVDASQKWLSIGKTAAMIVTPLVLGLIVGMVAQGAKVYNKSLTNAKWMAEQVEEARVSVGKLKSTMLKAQAEVKPGTDPRKKIVNQFKVPTKVTLAALKKAYEKFQPPKEESLERRMFDVPKALQAKVAKFYSDSNLLKKLLQSHLTQMKRDISALTQAAVPDVSKDAPEKVVCCQKDPADDKNKGVNCDPCMRVGNAKGEPNSYTPFRWAVYLPKKDEEEKKHRGREYGFGAVLVEVGKPYCEDPQATKNKIKVSDTNKCPQGHRLVGFKIRHDPTRTTGKQVWEPKFFSKIKGDKNELAELDRVMPLQPSAALEMLMIGSQPAVSNIRYQERMARIRTLTERVFKDGEALAAQLKAQAKKGKKFSFFL